MGESKMPAKIRVAQDADGFWTCREAVSGSPEYIRADLVEPLVEALRTSQAALAMMTAPKSIMATSTAQAYAHAYAAECNARTALQAYEAAQ